MANESILKMSRRDILGYTSLNLMFIWCIRLDLNQRPLPSEGNALSTELRMLVIFIPIICAIVHQVVLHYEVL